jgi:hypothetical protein
VIGGVIRGSRNIQLADIRRAYIKHTGCINIFKPSNSRNSSKLNPYLTGNILHFH